MNGQVRGDAWDDAANGSGAQGDGEWLTEVLDSEFGRYEPDSHRIRTLLDERLDGGAVRGAGHRSRSRVLRLRLAGVPAGIAAAALCATLAVAVTATVTDNHPNSSPNAASGRGGLPAAGNLPSGGNGRSQAGSPGRGTHGTVTGQAAGSATKPADPSESASASGSASASPVSIGSLVTAAGSVGSASNPTWTEEDVHMTLAAPVTALKLIIRVAPSAGLAPDSYWSNHDITAFNVTVNSDSNGLVYTFALKPGKTLPVGGFTIAAQFTHSRQRDASGDTFAASVTADQAHGSASAVAQGSF